MQRLRSLLLCLALGLSVPVGYASSPRPGAAEPSSALGSEGAQQVVRLAFGEQTDNPLLRYRSELIVAALAEMGVKAIVTGCEGVQGTFSEQRAALAIKAMRGCDLLVTSAGGELTAGLVVVPMPIYLGGGGHRVLLSTPTLLTRFPPQIDADSLKRLRLGSGKGWVDTHIMRANGLQVETSPVYAQLFRMLKAERFDALSRSVFEVGAELSGIASEGFALEPSVLLHYNTDLFFYTSPAQKGLREQLGAGLLRLFCSGKFQRHISEHAATRTLFSLVRPAQRRVIELHNPVSLTSEESTALARYGTQWLRSSPSAGLCD